ncbi:hemerythrin domain-containing protein [Thalassobius sp. MITS945101]|uniref:hemerythrin domain-containing protein n=1 Tax=Thalassobius sp. MITS945101 TaxID=3096994 RepID=UPI003999791F
MTQHDIAVRQGLPEEMQTLLREYPRDAWPDHPNFAGLIQRWMGAHTMFHQMAEIVTTDTKEMLDRKLDPDWYAMRLGHFGNALVRNLHGHHTWEDHKFFPELMDADNRFIDGLEILESDHEQMDQLLAELVRSSNRFIQLMDLSAKDAPDELPEVLKNAGAIQHFLQRHLSDEEDLAVPILLHHKLRG